MVKVGRNPQWTSLVIFSLTMASALAFGVTSASFNRKLLTSSVDSEDHQRRNLKFEMLPKGSPIPPTGPSRPPAASRGEKSVSRSLNFGMLPKGSPIPPSGPSRPPAKSPGEKSISRSLNFEMLPRGPVPPSGPSRPPAKVPTS